MQSGAKGIKILVSGRLGGAEIARNEKAMAGRVPLHTLRADIDFGQAEAHTQMGLIGVKVWIYRGDVVATMSSAEEAARREALISTTDGSPSGTDSGETEVQSEESSAPSPELQNGNENEETVTESGSDDANEESEE